MAINRYFAQRFTVWLQNFVVKNFWWTAENEVNAFSCKKNFEVSIYIFKISAILQHTVPQPVLVLDGSLTPWANGPLRFIHS